MKKNLYDILLIIPSFVFICFFGILLIFHPHSDFSEAENRALAKWQTPTFTDILDGSFSEHLSAIYTDQFPFRSSFTALKSNTELILGKGENNGILFGKNGYLLPRYEYNSLDITKENLAALHRFDEVVETRDIPLTTLFVPVSTDILTDCLPTLYSPSHTSSVLKAVKDSDVKHVYPAETLKKAAPSGREIYYKTDHHWTTFGAYNAYKELGESLGFVPFSEEYFTPENVSQNFYGTSHSTVGGIFAKSDEVILFRYQNDERFDVRNEETGEIRQGFYDLSALGKKDKYQVFLGGNYGRLTVKNTVSPQKPKLLLIKDSFANCLVPFLALHFDLDIIDLRYYQGSLQDVIESGDHDKILIVQGLDTLATDSSLSKLMLIEK